MFFSLNGVKKTERLNLNRQDNACVCLAVGFLTKSNQSVLLENLLLAFEFVSFKSLRVAVIVEAFFDCDSTAKQMFHLQLTITHQGDGGKKITSLFKQNLHMTCPLSITSRIYFKPNRLC